MKIFHSPGNVLYNTDCSCHLPHQIHMFFICKTKLTCLKFWFLMSLFWPISIFRPFLTLYLLTVRLSSEWHQCWLEGHSVIWVIGGEEHVDEPGVLPVLISNAPLINIHSLVKFCVALREYESAILVAPGAGITVTLVLQDDIEARRTVRGQEESSLHGVSIPSVEFFHHPSSPLVFEGLVQSGLLPLRGLDQDWDQST